MAVGKGLAWGILLAVCAGVLFASMDALAKELTRTLPVLQVVWIRFLVQTLLIAAYLMRQNGVRFMQTRRPVLQVTRGMALLAGTLLMYFSLRHVPLADATSVVFVTPMLIVVISVVVLKEAMSLPRTVAAVAGFVGVLLIVQPGSESTSPYLLLPLGCAILNSIYLMLTRPLSDVEEKDATQFVTTAVGTAVLAVVMVPLWMWPTPGQFALLVALGTAGAMSQFCLVSAFSYAPASLLAPFLYSQVLFASILSLAWFGDGFRSSMLAGTVILVASGLFIWWHESGKRFRWGRRGQ